MSDLPETLRLNLLSRCSGKPHIARTARRLASQAKVRGGASARLSSDAIANVLDGAHPTASLKLLIMTDRVRISAEESLTEPGLLLVVGGSYLRLHGFPPWLLRLTEIQCVQLLPESTQD